MVPNDVVIALGTGASVGKAGEKKGGSRYQERVAEDEWDFFFSFWKGSEAAVILGYGSATHVCWQQLDRPSFAYWFSFSCFAHSSLAWPALQAMQGLTLPPFILPPFIPLFMALMVLNNLYVSECTASSAHVGRAREQLGQSGRITWFHLSLKAAGNLTSTRFLYSPQSIRVRFSKRSKASGVIRALRERTLYLSV